MGPLFRCSPRFLFRCSSVLLFCVAASATASAQVADQPPGETSPLDEPESTEVRFSFTPVAWFPRMRGNSRLADPTPGGEIEFLTLRLDENEATFNGELNVRIDRFDAWLNLFDFSTAANAVSPRFAQFGALTIVPGDTVRSEMDLASVSAEVGYAFIPIDDETLTVRFSPLVGIRYFDLDQTVQLPFLSGAPRQTAGTDDLAAFAGARLQLLLDQQFYIDAGAGFGMTLGSGGHFYQVNAGIAWHPHPNAGVTVGYRLVDTFLEDDDFEFDGQLAGLFAGGSIRF